MIFSPLPGTPLITQGFGQNPDLYAPYGYAGHNGFDFGVPEGTPVFAPHDGVAAVKDDGPNGYGLYIVIEAPNRRSILAHLSQTTLVNGQTVYQGDPIAASGSSGTGTGPHLHWTFKILKNGAVQNKSNGYDGAMDVSELTRLRLPQDLHADALYAGDATPYLSAVFAADQVLHRVVS
ncbi:MAG: M23 family metallopeptidase [Candidatus Peribacteraceae bacterium]|nr:M23 family metallopeptidase [Candidatus Peribacteraceae bacterium]